ncbi:elicitor-responsive protein 1-like [Salvia hispanica]|uniref:elicitor-responsive protein 1-like n=1 Tax=Salvia hispanica TaxID=49212 RepID=UPI002009A5D1|nr:elicitor-responsive protein 1-like [Salvia hispanica]
MMMRGTMEVTVVGAKNLQNTEFFGRVDPYVEIHYNNQEQKSTTGRSKISKSLLRFCVCLKGQGSRKAVWNEKFKFKVELKKGMSKEEKRKQQHKLILKIIDQDNFTLDDFLGQATVYVNELLEIGMEEGKAEMPIQKYRVVASDKTYRGEIQVGVTFTMDREGDDQQELDGGKKLKTS